MSDILIEAQNVSKKYCRSLRRSLWYGVNDIGAEIFARNRPSQSTLRPEEFWAVNDVSFELRRGECLGLIGANGAGKSTLLKMLNGLIKPDQGRITMRGRVGALIELGAGFHPVLSGRENIYINAAILGMGKREVDKRLDQIIDFADIGPAIDSPVQTYSSGMRVRLGFAIAAHLEPDILLIDEVLAVGDAMFRSKCYQHIDKLLDQGTAIILVSHSANNIQCLCNIALLLSNGNIVYLGDPAQCLGHYISLQTPATANAPNGHSNNCRLTIADSRVSAARLLLNPPANEWVYMSPSSITIECDLNADIIGSALVALFRSVDGTLASSLTLNSRLSGVHCDLHTGHNSLTATIPSTLLPPGPYSTKISLTAGAFHPICYSDDMLIHVSVSESLLAEAPDLNCVYCVSHVQEA